MAKIIVAIFLAGLISALGADVRTKGAHTPTSFSLPSAQNPLVPPGVQPVRRKQVQTKGAVLASTVRTVKSAFIAPQLWLTWRIADYVWVEWDWTNSTRGLGGFILHSGLVTGNYTKSVDVGRATRTSFAPIDPAKLNFFVVSAHGTNRNELGVSEEVSWGRQNIARFVVKIEIREPDDAPDGVFEVQHRINLTEPWEAFAVVTNAFMPVTAHGNRFFRVMKK